MGTKNISPNLKICRLYGSDEKFYLEIYEEQNLRGKDTIRIALIHTILLLILLINTLTFASAIHPQINSLQKAVNTSTTYPLERKSNFTYSNKTIPPYPTIDTSPQKSSPFNATLFEEMISLTSINIEAWRTFSMPSSDVFLAVDGASQSRVLNVLIELYQPDGSLAKASNTTASKPFHILIPSPSSGDWKLHLKMINTGNTTVWVQAISYNHGAKIVDDYQKERIHLFAGQALYFKIPVSIQDWFDIYCAKLAGSYVNYELHKPEEYHLGWTKKRNTFDTFYSPTTLPTTGTYLLVVLNEGDVDVMIQITLPKGVSRTISVNEKFVMKFNLEYENEHIYINVDKTYPWFALAGAINVDNAWVRFKIINPDWNVETDQKSSATRELISKIVVEPDTEKYILILRGSSNAYATTQLTSAGNEAGSITESFDQKIIFTQSGQTIYYLIPTTAQSIFTYLGTSLTSKRSSHKIFDFRLEQKWYGYSSGLTDPELTRITAVGGSYLVQIQGEVGAKAMVHLRFKDEEDYSLTTPDYSDFKFRFTGDVMVYTITIQEVDYFVQYWHSLGEPDITVWIYNSNNKYMWNGGFSNINSESRLIWRKDFEDLYAGEWIVILTGEKDGAIRVSQLQAGDEENRVSPPFQVFETYSFDYQAKIFLADIPQSVWLSLVAQTQTDKRLYLKLYDSNLNYKWSAESRGNTDTEHGYWKSPKAGKWLLIMDGLLGTNASIAFHTSNDPMPILSAGQNKIDEFNYYGDAHYYKLEITKENTFAGFDIMWLTEGLRTYVNFISSDGSIMYSGSSTTKFNVGHDLTYESMNGTWYVIAIGQLKSSIIFRITISPDNVLTIPFKQNLPSQFDGTITYVQFQVPQKTKLQINFTSNSETDTWIWLYDASKRQQYQMRFYNIDQFKALVFSEPKPGNWLLCLVQEKYANMTVSIAISIEPSPKPMGIFIEFIQPSDAQAIVVENKIRILPEINGTIGVILNITDFYHAIIITNLYYHGGANYTSLTFNTTSEYYNTSFDTTKYVDGLHELVAYVTNDVGEVGIASIAVLVDNHNTFGNNDSNKLASSVWLEWWFWIIIAVIIISGSIAFRQFKGIRIQKSLKSAIIKSVKSRSKEDFKICPKCGTKLLADSTFCGQCGTSLGTKKNNKKAS